MNGKSVTVSIVIPAHNAEGTIAHTLACAKAQDALPSPPEVIVVDDGSADHTAEVVKREGVRYIYQPNGGPAAARNTGFRSARGQYVLFTDADCLPDRAWAARLIEALAEPEVGAAGGSYTMANDGLIASGIHWEIIARHRRFGRYVRAMGSYNLGVRGEVLESVGGFDESYPSASGEDNDLSYRILAAGYRLRWVPQATVAHFHTERLGKYLKEQYRHGYFRAKLYRQHLGKVSGDDYTTIKDILEPPMVLALAASVGLSGLGWLPVAGPLVPLALLAGIQIPAAVRMVRLSGRLSVACHAPTMFLRAFARTLGLLSGAASTLLKSRPRRKRR